MIPAITNALLRDAIQSDGMIQSGLAYFQQSRVNDLEIDDELCSATATIRGSGRNEYETSVVFEDERGGTTVDSDCSCPIGYGCKHAAALLYALRQKGSDAALSAKTPGVKQSSPVGLKIAAAEAAPPTISGAIGEWLAASALGHATAQIEPEPICFVIETAQAFRPAKRAKGIRNPQENVSLRYWLSIRAWRRGRSGGAFHVVQPYQVQQSSVHADPQAKRLLARMGPAAAGGDFNAQNAPDGRYGWQWLCEAAQTGLLRWKKANSAPVTIAPADLTARLDWHVLGGGKQMLMLVGIDEELTVFAGDPPIFFDPARHEIGLIDTGIAPKLAGRLLAMPPVSPIEMLALAARWHDIGASEVPLPRPPEPIEIAGPPRPVLRFLTDKVNCLEYGWGWGKPRFRSVPAELARLEFDYAGHRVGAAAPAQDMVVSGPQGLLRFSRDLAAEQSAVDVLAATLLKPIAVHDKFQPKPHQTWDHAPIDTASAGIGGWVAADLYPEFLANELEGLKAAGWLIEYASDWEYSYQPLDSQDAQLAVSEGANEGSGAGAIDWFDVELAALVDGQRIDILPALRRLLAGDVQQLLERNDKYLVPLRLGGGHFTALRFGAVRPLVEALLRLALASPDKTTLRLDRYDLGSVHEIAASGLSWASADALRQLAEALHTPDQTGFSSPPGLEARLRPYQEVGANWLRALYGASLGGILADDMGLGKTLQAIAHILHVRQCAQANTEPCRPILIVAPTSVLPNWRAELARFALGLDCLLWHGADRQGHAQELAAAAIVLTSYPLLARDQEILSAQDYALVVLDEAHILKNPKTRGFKAAAVLKARQIIALSGTPIETG